MKILKRTLRIIAFFVLTLLGLLLVYSINPYKPQDEMYDTIELSEDITQIESWDNIAFTQENSHGHIILISGGKVEAKSYLYLATELANNGYNVTLFRPLLNLSILTGSYPDKFVVPGEENTVVGHSLGGITASSIASNKDVQRVVLLGSYSVNDISDVNVLVILGELDTVINMDAFEENEENLGDYTKVVIEGGNHGQFGWYGKQAKDTDATITAQEQQDRIVQEILIFMENS